MRTFEYTQRVYFSDTDAQGIVYHGRYLDFAEHARTELARTFGASGLMGTLAFVVKRIEIDYQKSAVLDDVLTVVTQVEELGRFSLVFLQTIRRGDEVVCTLRVKVACVDLATKRLARLDDRLIEALR